MRGVVVSVVMVAAHLGVFSAAVLAREFARPLYAQAASTTGAPTTAAAWRIDEIRARKTVQAHGYQNVRNLSQDKISGIWSGTASKYDRTIKFEIDQNGNFDTDAIQRDPS